MKFCCFPYCAVLCFITTLTFTVVNAIDEDVRSETFQTKGSTRIVQTENTIDVYCKSIIACAGMCLSDPQCCLASYSKGVSTCRIDTSELCCVETETFDEWRFIQRNSYQGRPIDCNDIPDKCQSGVYKVFPNQTQGFDVYCEMNLDEGHWTVFQRRQNGYVDFYRGWNEYKSGFENPNHEFWLGNENLHSLTSQHNYEMRIDLIDFDGNTAFAKYKEFAIGDESSKFKLSANEYHGTAGNSLEHHNGHGFSTKDSDNDNYLIHCATVFPGAWWLNACVTSDLNGQYFQKTPDSGHRGVYWRSWKGSNYSQKAH
ncbi:Fibrinogen-like protein A,Ryncolin-4,Angiopoietin-related protein 7,Ficolin-1-B,Techylectin-5A,Ficolin-2,Ryncolin-1,Tenascin-R,Fibrinogen-like protein 1,Angiopoietin-1,Tenascin-X,Fibrinogen C domain-containing protein 1-A,Ryncolin-3,Tenascin,Techylectin-like protein,Fibrinogen C domain-containing protein 1,Ryncolin-2,Angiopoietin-related protein 6,Techylectin-5B,Angiopoietin-related protein 2,Angiopoietin-2,Microfibril-associated glycoprotein 4,Ficolin-1-A,Ficolin-1,Fibrinogen C domain-containing protein 1|uniref:Fibrinogen C-terminal domain-containing protein n=1 Tax=Mytilus coruscus TaxID=42192 RepID=A0A6J8E965_MYTCO|nr:Fibrinogen-like protein A,Ryncolin-4,Angiopoietin-related protein 7,Ficolin-1-B,Techylectin-5A,Ficolin-2,Ryncolin-1,Tenascin-R,Fibrinogen-like protein 1,Angiopoietin-1,Tenascin-X,Fibrinogen C domain-containing protein 1-A,Ryncolin-3,Tenascin,Techylectin-like protein,Fibrinogen C domain-containing protein 1,Ryncolin-2,Angiopoietin-related protein 6,Techylectin-5B,Angiopoietin-related protein 2,Angiopoietin-2,Microfibril-associated glycoprotein 4,Ficolin-1-A,Ficolin-1,Fibrinogen C domain-containin